MSSSNSPRTSALRAIATRPTQTENAGLPPRTSEYFGSLTFGARQMRAKLPPDVYAKLSASIRLGKKLDTDIAPVVAQTIKEWAMALGVTHFTHWFQPQTGSTAEKHDAFLSFDDAMTPLETFSAAQLIQSEPDASSFPSGGLRATWEARGYTAWNPASPVFIIETAGVKTLCVPSVFIGYNGEALDEMTPLLRSTDVLSQKAIELLEVLGDTGVQRVYTTMGTEQEYFLIDRAFFAMRPDLVMGGRSLVGAPPPRGQQLEDHYFGGIPERVQACIAEVEHELYKLGVPITTRHNEVAPCQFEMAPHYEETDVAVDHNQMVMSVLKKVALRHGLQALLHEKPFAGINGSGKHCNWSMAIAASNPELNGFNLLKPGKTPHQNVRFLLFLAAVQKAVHKHAGLLRAGIATSGNEHRLGANEAPPAIISIFMGEMLTKVINEIADGKTGGKTAAQRMLDLGVNKLPEIAQDNTDRNRTSPFAFTGMKFEFRAVGSSQSIAFPVMLLNAAAAEAIAEMTVELKKLIKKGTAVDDAVLAVVSKAFRETKAVRFEGNGYSEAWVKEAAKRGLPNFRKTPEALEQLVTPAVAQDTHVARHPLRGRAREPLPRAHGALREGRDDRALHHEGDGRHAHPARRAEVPRRAVRRRRCRQGGRHQGDSAGGRGEPHRRHDRYAADASRCPRRRDHQGRQHARHAHRPGQAPHQQRAPAPPSPSGRSATHSRWWWTTALGRCRSTGRSSSRSDRSWKACPDESGRRGSWCDLRAGCY